MVDTVNTVGGHGEYAYLHFSNILPKYSSKPNCSCAAFTFNLYRLHPSSPVFLTHLLVRRSAITSSRVTAAEVRGGDGVRLLPLGDISSYCGESIVGQPARFSLKSKSSSVLKKTRKFCMYMGTGSHCCCVTFIRA